MQIVPVNSVYHSGIYRKQNSNNPVKTLTFQKDFQTYSTGKKEWQKDEKENIIVPIKINPATLKEGQLLNKSKTRIHNRHATSYFRSDLNWFELGKYLQSKFSDNDKVNTYIWGCSEGQEAYSLAILLKLYFKSNSDKFFPIKAGDISSEIIDENEKFKKEGVLVDGLGYERAIVGIGMNPDKAKRFYEAVPDEPEYLKLKEEITDNINFSCSNIVTDADKIDKETPSIVMARNMWPYVNPENYDNCAKKLYDNLAKGSVVIIGGYDWDGEDGYKDSDKFPYKLMEVGFKPVNTAQGLRYNTSEKGKPFFIYEK